ncbi:hypothetical protein [Streptomyces sp. NPDC001537]
MIITFSSTANFDTSPSLGFGPLGHFESWFFHDTDDDLDGWADGLARQEFWVIVRHFHPQEIRIYQEQV